MTLLGQVQINELLAEVPRRGATDLHLMSGRAPGFRVDAELQFYDQFGIVQEDHIQSLIDAFISDDDREELDQQGQVVFSFSFQNQARFRVFVYHQKGALTAVFHYLPFLIPKFQELGMDRLQGLLGYQSGIVFFSGPRGSGKTTSVVSFLNALNTQYTKNIVTIEDPMEYLIVPDKSMVTQRQVGKDVRSVAQGLDAMRHLDADVVYVDELRDREEVMAAIRAARMGYLVLTTLYATDSVNTLENLIGRFLIDERDYIRAQLASVVQGVVVQRLVPKLGGGRVVAYETMFVDASIRSMIETGRLNQIPSRVQSSPHLGMLTLDMHLSQLVREQKIHPQVALQYAIDREAFKSQVRS